MPGIIQARDIAGSLDAKNIVLGVLQKQIELSNLLQLTTEVPVPELKATIPIQSVMEGYEDLDEWEWSQVEGSEFEAVEFNLKKDRVKVGRSDEAKYRSSKGDPLVLQKDAAGMRLANILDKKIVRALEVDPLTGAAAAKWSTVTNNPLIDISNACADLLPYTADYIIMHPKVWAAFTGNDYTSRFIQGNPEKLQGVLTTIPGLNLKVFVNGHVTPKSCIIGASGAPSVALGNGPVEVREYDSPRGGVIYQIDVFRQAVAPIMKDDDGKNMAAYHLTGVIA